MDGNCIWWHGDVHHMYKTPSQKYSGGCSETSCADLAGFHAAVGHKVVAVVVAVVVAG